ncbi:Clp protease ClpP [Chitinimonas arctica]|uniref:ATP-dependent Clp protease proteolytic subunit n=1 Tax=Chitinimonas arctica TaxID=2594795 RepID=A0A516SFB0_9NEIS|nr:ClpP-like prohead protease/major capsid protein fusion protein [Chitinimonas arctica]QDQ26708.1 Clp protease ClpP [Chitinimonas arctica]
MGSPYIIRAKAAGEAQEVFIYGDIGESWYDESVAAKDFVREIAALDTTAITVRLNSYGGSVADGLAIYNALKRHPAAIHISIDGVAASIASLIAMAGDTVEIADNALMMIHAPWGYAGGNSVAMREYADLLDTYAQAMTSSYVAKSGMTNDAVLALLTDGADHWYTANEALAAGWVDSVTNPTPVTASASLAGLSRFKSLPSALASRLGSPAASTSEKTMPLSANPVAAPAPAPASATPVDEQAIVARGIKAEADRRTAIRASFARFQNSEGVAALLTACENDTTLSAQAAGEKLLAHLGRDATPVAGGHVVTVEDERDKFRAAATESVLARSSVQTKDGLVRATGANPYRGHTLLDLARASLARANIRTDGMDKMQIVAAAFTQSGSDFPILLENAMHKSLQAAYAIAADTWTRFCARGSVSDFRAHPRYRVGSLGNLDSLSELGEFKNKSIPDGEKAAITAGTKGNIINLSRQAVINDDLGAFVGLATMLGRAAKRTVEADVYALLASNPVMKDGNPLFHASHGNIGVAAPPSVASFDEARVLMAKQKDVGGNDFLDLRPAIWLGPTGMGGDAKVINGAEYDPDTSNKLQKPNKVRGLFSDLVDSPRLDGTAWYAFANPVDAPVIEVAFLDGQDQPFLELENGFSVDGARYKVRLDYGTGAIDHRGATMNNGTPPA